MQLQIRTAKKCSCNCLTAITASIGIKNGIQLVTMGNCESYRICGVASKRKLSNCVLPNCSTRLCENGSAIRFCRIAEPFLMQQALSTLSNSAKSNCSRQNPKNVAAIRQNRIAAHHSGNRHSPMGSEQAPNYDPKPPPSLETNASPATLLAPTDDDNLLGYCPSQPLRVTSPYQKCLGVSA